MRRGMRDKNFTERGGRNLVVYEMLDGGSAIVSASARILIYVKELVGRGEWEGC